jgi:hypothetical protein
MKLHIARRIRVLLFRYCSCMARRSVLPSWGCSTMCSLSRHACPVCVRHESSCVSRPLPRSLRRLGLDPRPHCPATPLSPAGAGTSPPCSLMRRPSQMSAMRADRCIATFPSPSSLTWGMVGCPCRRRRRFAP